MGLIPIIVFVNVGMMYPVIGMSAANCMISSMAFAVDFATCTFAVPYMILIVLVSSGPCGAFGAIYR